jgi:hypothetical protein
MRHASSDPDIGQKPGTDGAKTSTFAVLSVEFVRNFRREYKFRLESTAGLTLKSRLSRTRRNEVSENHV